MEKILDELGAHAILKPEWATFTTTASLEFLDNVGGLRLLMALRSAAADPTAKSMVAAAVKSVVFRNVSTDNDYAIKFDPKNGEIFLACQFDRLNSSNGSNILSYAQIFEELMKHLNVKVAQQRLTLEQKQLPERSKELEEILGKHVPYEVLWSTFSTADELNFVDNVSCHRISMALRCTFGPAKETLSKHLQKVQLANGTEKSIEYKDGILKVVCQYAKGLDGAFSDGDIRAYLTSNIK